ncbi:MAG: peptidylprolyl isomerase [Gammaproteobacteria bacterium]
MAAVQRLLLGSLLTLTLTVGGCDRLPGGTTSQAPSPADQAAKTKLPADTLAVVNGQPISKPMLELYREGRAADHPHDAKPTQQELLHEYVNLILLAQTAARDGLAKHPDVARKLAYQRTNLLAGSLIEQMLTDMRISDAEIQQEYDRQIKAEPQREYKARNILVTKRAQAEQVIDSLNKGADFATLARKYSIGPAASAGGALQWFQPRNVLPAFAHGVAQLHKGEYTKTPIKTRYGWNVVLLEDYRELPPPPLDRVRQRIRVELARKRLDAYMDKLRGKADIHIIEPASGQAQHDK